MVLRKFVCCLLTKRKKGVMAQQCNIHRVFDLKTTSNVFCSPKQLFSFEFWQKSAKDARTFFDDHPEFAQFKSGLRMSRKETQNRQKVLDDLTSLYRLIPKFDMCCNERENTRTRTFFEDVLTGLTGHSTAHLVKDDECLKEQWVYTVHVFFQVQAWSSLKRDHDRKRFIQLPDEAFEKSCCLLNLFEFFLWGIGKYLRHTYHIILAEKGTYLFYLGLLSNLESLLIGLWGDMRQTDLPDSSKAEFDLVKDCGFFIAPDSDSDAEEMK